MEGYAANAKLPLPRPLMRPALPLTARLMALKNKARDDTARADLLALPGLLDRIDAWIADGLLGGERPNAADLQIGSTIRLLATIGDVRPLIGDCPASQLTRYFPPMVGEFLLVCCRPSGFRRRPHVEASDSPVGATVAGRDRLSRSTERRCTVTPCVPWTRSP